MEIILLIIIVGMLSYLIYDKNSHVTHFSRKSIKETLIDTSILIDGRILSVAKTGFMGGYKMLIPRSVVGELQLLADGSDDDKRSRARYGLDIISSLQAISNLEVEILQDGASASEGVDNRLLSLAKERGATICTADYNLNKVAKVEGVDVLNINELAQSVRASYLPGEKLMLEFTQKGNEKKQAVGHLPDGTMVVVENGEHLVGSTNEVEFIRMLQTAAGKMMFAKLSGAKSPKTEKPKTIGRKLAQIRPPKQAISKKTNKSDYQKSLNSEKNKDNAKRQPRNNSHRRKSPEDSMVALANK